MAVANTTTSSNELNRNPRQDSTAARVGRFVIGSVFGIIFIVFCFLMLNAALKGPDTITAGKASGPIGLVGKAPADHLKVGDTPPDFALAQLGGEPVQLSKLTGKTVFINFWASWCDPCRQEMPDIQRFYLQHKNDNVVVLAVNVKEDADTIKSYFKTNNLSMPVLMDTTAEVPGAFRVTAYPETYIIGKDGKVGAFNIGAMDYDKMEAKLQETWAKAGK
ncbi:MAG TPA: TlpA disulfide reductase family protein [Chloroflexia bacterium]|nr:TlpA disulfide reductase family protein [Chloroflexia bacterium]